MILKGGEIMHKFDNPLISLIYIFFQNTFKLYVISYIFLSMFEKEKNPISIFFWILILFFKGENVLHFFIISNFSYA